MLTHKFVSLKANGPVKFPKSGDGAFAAYFAFSVAFGYRKCYYSFYFKERDSWDMIFDVGGS